MLLSHIYDYAHILCGIDKWQVDYFYPLIAWSFEMGNYTVFSVDGSWTIFFYTFCDISDVEEIRSYEKYLSVLARRQKEGKVVIPYLVCGSMSVTVKNLFRMIMRRKKIKKAFYWRTKTNKFYIWEV